MRNSKLVKLRNLGSVAVSLLCLAQKRYFVYEYRFEVLLKEFAGIIELLGGILLNAFEFVLLTHSLVFMYSKSVVWQNLDTLNHLE